MIRVINKARFVKKAGESDLSAKLYETAFNAFIQSVIKEFSKKQCPEKCPNCQLVITGSRIENLKAESPNCPELQVSITTKR
jgi:hypothetical protein